MLGTCLAGAFLSYPVEIVPLRRVVQPCRRSAGLGSALLAWPVMCTTRRWLTMSNQTALGADPGTGLPARHGVRRRDVPLSSWPSSRRAPSVRTSPLRLLLATLEPVPGKPAPIPAASAARLFEGLRQSLRDTDVMGWYRQDRVAGAVLSARPDAQGPETSDLIEQRVGEGLRQRLPAKVARGLRVRVVQQGPQRSRMSIASTWRDVSAPRH